MEVIQGQVLQGHTISMDDKKFIDCLLIDCVIEYSGRPVILERTAIRGCRYTFSGPAKMTLEFLDCIGLHPFAAAARQMSELCLVH